MPVNNDQREYWTQKNPAAEYETVTFTHPAFSEPIRLVANCFSEQVFNGQTYLPVAAKVKLPEQSKDPVSSATIQFSRPHIGDEFKRVIRQLTPFDWFTPIKVILSVYTELDRDNPIQNWALLVAEKGIRINKETVQITASDDNPMILNLSLIYNTERYPGLRDL